MGRKLILEAADGHQIGAYRADPTETPRGRVVVIQEIFGVNHHIRAVCDRLAAAGYIAVAPQIFDRLQRNFESGYSEAEVEKAREYIPRLDWAKVLLDTHAAIDVLKREGPVAVLGFCLGGSVAFIAATKLDGLAAAVCYYGGQVVNHAVNKPRCPTQMHFGEKDAHIPLTDVAAIRSKRPDCDIHVYQGAGHGFHCDERASYEPRSAKMAWERSLAFLARAFSGEKMPAKPPAKAKLKRKAAAKLQPKKPAKAKSKPKPKAKKKAKPKMKKKAKPKAKKKSRPKSKKRR